mmetsp:Transcript_62876/g.174268  ORF Transcript_62876/g.174268 Transcript_62876/m.174268 type:complete len:217 (-) Transcript_62876:80-730(-)
MPSTSSGVSHGSRRTWALRRRRQDQCSITTTSSCTSWERCGLSRRNPLKRLMSSAACARGRKSSQTHAASGPGCRPRSPGKRRVKAWKRSSTTAKCWVLGWPRVATARRRRASCRLALMPSSMRGQMSSLLTRLKSGRQRVTTRGSRPARSRRQRVKKAKARARERGRAEAKEKARGRAREAVVRRTPEDDCQEQSSVELPLEEPGPMPFFRRCEA